MDGSGANSAANVTRWNPTKEQVSILEGLYGQGMRTPTADQIQHITSRLRAYGHIEGKNVFYWFQNHKARQRQKEKELQQQQMDQHHGRLSFSYLNRRCLYFHKGDAPATTPGLVYSPAPPHSSSDAMFMPYYVPQIETAKLLPPHTGRTMISTEASPFGHHHTVMMAAEALGNSEKSTLDLFPVHPTRVDHEHGRRTAASPCEDLLYSDYATGSCGGDMRDRPFFDFLSVNR
ncbi:hypothetical protein MLD38_017341 [Melastoma candidum]|uniref:Uncharacterized protein n=1 Tax=Melastoma candidum TaxID=119954 RepID=A0ACB9QQB5_9MYRT|nr:hypothetical protein MLD38_017341 [Melastoma candidum]